MRGNGAEQYRQINAVIEILKQARPCGEDAKMTSLVESALGSAELLRYMMRQTPEPLMPAGLQSAGSELAALEDESFPGDDPAELCFPV